jgi:beta-galactosidase
VLNSDPRTFWHAERTDWDRLKTPPPHHLVIDLGREREVAGLRYLPRSDSENGRIRDFRVYLTQEPFGGL